MLLWERELSLESSLGGVGKVFSRSMATSVLGAPLPLVALSLTGAGLGFGLVWDGGAALAAADDMADDLDIVVSELPSV